MIQLPPPTGAYDVLCYGAICADFRMRIPRLPAPGQGVRVSEARWEAGGNSLIEARALAGWGMRVALLGDALGHDAPGDVLAAELARLGLHDHVRRDPAAQTVVCHVMVTPDGQRTILALRPEAPPPPPPSPELLAACRVLGVTRFSPRAAEVAAAAKAAGRVVVAGDARAGEELARHTDVAVTSADTLAEGGRDVAAAMAELHAVRGAAVVVTDGPRPARALWREHGELRSAAVAPPPVAAHDTTGAGDVFRAAVIRGLLLGQGWPETLRAACEEASRAVAG
jgi:sugar/nucleoside kinase (ribokinase family)